MAERRQFRSAFAAVLVIIVLVVPYSPTGLLTATPLAPSSADYAGRPVLFPPTSPSIAVPGAAHSDHRTIELLQAEKQPDTIPAHRHGGTNFSGHWVLVKEGTTGTPTYGGDVTIKQDDRTLTAKYNNQTVTYSLTGEQTVRRVNARFSTESIAAWNEAADRLTITTRALGEQEQEVTRIIRLNDAGQLAIQTTILPIGHITETLYRRLL
jgi:hypothetical protein